jgi:transmembrane sensor
MDTNNTFESGARKGRLAKAIARGVGGAAGAAAMIYLFLLALSSHAPEARTLVGSYSTVKGEHRCETLPDDSRVCLNTASVVRYSYGRKARNLELVSGEASFEVRGTGRQFDVLAGGMLVHDLSTSFNIRKEGTSTTLTILDGRVRVVAPIDPDSRLKLARVEPESAWQSAPEYHRLQQVEFDEATGKLHERPVLTERELAQLLAWQRGRIDLTNKPLSEALEEFARYQSIEEFHFQDKKLRQLRVGGELEATHLMDFLDSLTKVYGIQHTLSRGPDGQTVVNLSRRQRDSAHAQTQ